LVDEIAKKPVDKSDTSGGARAKEPRAETFEREDRGERPTTQSLARDRELSRLLDDYNDGGVGELLFAQDAVNLSARRSTSGEKPIKVLSIPDFISYRRGTLDDDDDAFVTSKGLRYKLEGRNKKLLPSEVTIPQWISANERIADLLCVNFSPREVKDYRKYVQHIGDLLQMYTSDSVFSLDHYHRKEMAYNPENRWSDIDQHMVNFYLTRAKGTGGNMGNPGSANPAGAGQQEGKTKKKKKLAHPCVRYNSKEGCRYKNNCTFPHICAEPGCMGNHPSFEHSSFRSDSGGKQTTP
jgi:hypothetical protein